MKKLFCVGNSTIVLYMESYFYDILLEQGILTEGQDSVQLTSLYILVLTI